MRKQISIDTHTKTQVIDVTTDLAALVGDVADGLVLFSVPHTTAALIVSEIDDELADDIVKVAENMLADLRPFKHIRKNNPNTEAHVFSALAGTGVTLAVEDGKLVLGTYQNLLLLELDGPKTRTIDCKIVATG